MNRLKYLILICSAILFCGVTSSCTEDEAEVNGNVHGYVSDETTGEPIRTASVTLNPGGKKTATGSDGRFEYNDLEAGQYTLQVSKDGYQTNTAGVTIIAGQTAQCDILLKPGTGNLAASKTELNFGKDNTILAFEVVNTGKTEIQWDIKKDCSWIKDIDPISGTTAADKKSPVSITIDRSKLEAGKTNATTIIITSNSGTAEINVLAESKSTTPDPDDPETPGEDINITAGLLAYYTFDNSDASDISGNKMNGVALNEPEFTTDSPSGKGKALFLNAAKEQLVNIPYNPLKGKYSYSISFWIKDFGSLGYIIGGVSKSWIGECYPRIYVADNKFGFSHEGFSMPLMGSIEPDPFTYPVKQLQNGKWHSIVFTASANKDNKVEKLLYIDGNLADNLTAKYNVGNDDSSTKIQIGGTLDGQATDAMNMKIDNVRLYDRPLTAAEVETIYTSEKAQ